MASDGATTPGLTYESLLASFRAKTAGDGAKAHAQKAQEYGKLWRAEGVENGADIAARKEKSRDMVNFYCEFLFSS